MVRWIILTPIEFVAGLNRVPSNRRGAILRVSPSVRKAPGRNSAREGREVGPLSSFVRRLDGVAPQVIKLSDEMSEPKIY